MKGKHPFKRGDFVYFFDTNQARINATVRKTTQKRVTVKASFPDGSRIINVVPAVLSIQGTRL